MTNKDSIYGFGAVILSDFYDPTGRFDSIIVRARTLRAARIKAKKLLLKKHYKVLDLWEEQIVPMSI